MRGDVEPDPAPKDELAARVEELRERYGEQGFSVVAEPPFVVIGDGSQGRVAAHAAGTVRWAVEHLEAAYFEKPPTALVTIWLFESEESYRRNTLAIFGDRPETPYGYYTPTHDALIMNIATGGGTLVHEIVHPYMAANFPECPDWFNEGLASLYEQASERDGEIIGLTNWRLAGLQEALKRKAVPSFRTLLSSGDGFYSDDPGSNYAQARYLCHWLQEEGLLRTFYRSFVAAAEDDPTGLATLERTIGMDMKQFRPIWERYVMGLRFD